MPSKGLLQSLKSSITRRQPHCGTLQAEPWPHQGEWGSLEMTEPHMLQYKLLEPVLLLGKEQFAGVDICVCVKGGGHVAQIYAVRQLISKALVAYYQKYVDETSMKEIKDTLIQCNWTLLVANPRPCKSKKFGGSLPEILPISSP